VRLDSVVPRAVTPTSGGLATPISPVPPLAVPGWLRRAAGVVGELLTLVSIVFCMPLAILAIGIPIVLCARLLLWLGGML